MCPICKYERGFKGISITVFDDALIFLLDQTSLFCFFLKTRLIEILFLYKMFKKF